MKNTVESTTSRWKHGVFLCLVSVLTVMLSGLASCSAGRVGVAHNYSNEFGNGTIYVEGASRPGYHKPPKPPKKPKKPKKQKVKKHKKHDHRHDHR